MDGGFGLHESLLEISPIGMAILAGSGQILYANPAFAEVFDEKPSGLVNRPIADIAPTAARSYVVERIASAGKVGDARCKWAIEPGQPWIELFIERALEHRSDYLLVRAWRGAPFAAVPIPQSAQTPIHVSEPQSEVTNAAPKYAIVDSPEEPAGESALINVSVLAAEVADDLRRRTGANPAIKIQPDMTLRTDIGLLRLVLQHLIDNSIKFVVPGDTARIEIGQTDGVLYVRDGGIGFESVQAANIFKPFERLPGAEQYPGAGIGLASVKRIVERLGGMVWAISKPNRGATFFVRL
jgi:hypothetical protein